MPPSQLCFLPHSQLLVGRCFQVCSVQLWLSTTHPKSRARIGHRSPFFTHGNVHSRPHTEYHSGFFPGQSTEKPISAELSVYSRISTKPRVQPCGRWFRKSAPSKQF
ncbi:hypothetical protein ACOMHN_007047 [Nucella lapillus]